MSAVAAGLALLAGLVTRTDVQIAAEPGMSLHIREVRIKAAPGVPILLVHGARVPGVASFDLPVPGGSLAADLAAAGHRVFLLDLRGYGGSTRPAAMNGPPEAHPPLVRSDEAVRDIAAAVEWIRKRTGTRRVALLGWATGGHWAGMYAALYPGRASHLIVLNSLYGADAPHPLMGRGSDTEDRAHPGQLNPAIGAYGWVTEPSLLRAWDRSIPVPDKTEWRDSAVARAYVDGALASDPTSGRRTPPSFRSPNGALEDSFYQAIGRQLWDASLVRAATLILRSERDFWSRPEDIARLEQHLVHAARVKVVTLAGATHHVHLDRPERGRMQLLEEILAFLRD
jgi:pimeloyl-ACP methyl ester carboxylesterase